MSEPSFREIQLTGKQLVFLFMLSVIVAVAVFLLGVSVGRGVPNAEPATRVAEGVPPPAEGEMPPPTDVTPEQRAVLGELNEPVSGGRQSPAVQDDPSSAVIDEPPGDAEPVPGAGASEPVEPPAVEPEPAPAQATPAATRPATPPPTGPAAPPTRTVPAGQWVVQTNAYRSRASADREATDLRGRGFDAFVDANSPTGLFRVRIGPFRERDEANQVAARLRQQGSKPLVTR